MGSLSHLPHWPQTAHFTPLHKPLCGTLHFAKWEDYGNLARNTSTSDVVTPFCSVWPLRQGTYKVEAASPEKNKHPLAHLHWCTCPSGVDTRTAKHIWLEMQALLAAPGVFPASVQRELFGGTIGDDLVIWFWLLPKIL